MPSFLPLHHLGLEELPHLALRAPRMQEVADIVGETLDSGKRAPPSSHPWC